RPRARVVSPDAGHAWSRAPPPPRLPAASDPAARQPGRARRERQWRSSSGSHRTATAPAALPLPRVALAPRHGAIAPPRDELHGAIAPPDGTVQNRAAAINLACPAKTDLHAAPIELVLHKLSSIVPLTTTEQQFESDGGGETSNPASGAAESRKQRVRGRHDRDAQLLVLRSDGKAHRRGRGSDGAAAEELSGGGQARGRHGAESDASRAGGDALVRLAAVDSENG
ncbi:hypothetical protein EJB05_28162, partial [Eragrostis curvula]